MRKHATGPLIGSMALLLDDPDAPVDSYQRTSADDNAAMATAALRGVCPPGTPLSNRRQRRAAAARYGGRGL